VLRRAQRVLETPASRRGRRDDEQLRLVLASILAPDSSCVDVGANVGDVLEVIATVAPHARHVAYEPLPALADGLARRFPDVVVRAVALADAPGDARFVHVPGAPALSGLRAVHGASHPVEALPVPVRTLDDDLPRDLAPRFIKIDVEGAELQVLRGAARTLEEHRPLVAFEHSGAAAAYGTTSEDVWRFLAARGMRVFDMDGRGPLGLDEFVSAVSRGVRWNFFARA
jgi:FkbM family methyltransferase